MSSPCRWKPTVVGVLITAAISACGNKDSQPASKPPAVPTTSAQQASNPAAATVAFWNWLNEHAAALHAEKDLQNVMASISDQLERGHPGLVAEIGEEDGDRRTLVISADGNKKLFPLVDEVYAARPTVNGWNIVAFRQRDKEPFAIEMHGLKLDPTAMKYVSERGPDKLAIIVFVPGFTDTAEMKQGLYMVLDHTIGEYDMETRIGGIDFAPIDKAPADATPLMELPPLIDKTFPRPSPR